MSYYSWLAKRARPRVEPSLATGFHILSLIKWPACRESALIKILLHDFINANSVRDWIHYFLLSTKRKTQRERGAQSTQPVGLVSFNQSCVKTLCSREWSGRRLWIALVAARSAIGGKRGSFRVPPVIKLDSRAAVCFGAIHLHKSDRRLPEYWVETLEFVNTLSLREINTGSRLLKRDGRSGGVKLTGPATSATRRLHSHRQYVLTLLETSVLRVAFVNFSSNTIICCYLIYSLQTISWRIFFLSHIIEIFLTILS